MTNTAIDALGDLFISIDHVGIAVPDLDEAVGFYVETFGADNVHEEVNEQAGVREAMVRVGTSDVLIQLLAPLSPETAIGKFLATKGPGLQQLALRVTDVVKASEVLREQGMTMLYDEPRRGTSNSRINFMHPKSGRGVLIELVEPAAKAH